MSRFRVLTLLFVFGLSIFNTNLNGQDPVQKIVVLDQENDDSSSELIVEEEALHPQGIVVQRSLQSSSINGKTQTKTSGKLIVIDPNGQRREVILDGDKSDLSMQLGDLFPTSRVGIPEKRYVIGVFCNPISEPLISQLGVDSGLVVDQFSKSSPASEQGLQLYDVLVSANQKPLNSTNDLVEATQLAGKENRSLSLEIIRRGKTEVVELTPELKKIDSRLPLLLEDSDMFLKAGPGMIVPGGVDQAFEEMMQRSSHEMMESIKKRMQKMEQELRAWEEMEAMGKVKN